jgi:hypothetical protein
VALAFRAILAPSASMVNTDRMADTARIGVF